MNSLSVVIPVYNAEQNLEKLCAQLLPALDEIADDFEVILVDDGSADQSWRVVTELRSKNEHVHGIKLSRNYGQHNALLCGIRAARFEVIITMDDDLQNPVSEIPKLLRKLDEGFDVVYGSPKIKQFSFFRNLATRLTKLVLQGIMGAENAKNVSTFRAFRARLRDGFSNYDSPYVSVDVLLTWATSSFTAIEVDHLQRNAGESNYTLKMLASHAIDLMTGFSTVPLRIASVIGFVFTLFGFVVLAWVVGRFLFYDTSVPGFPFLASIIAIFSGAQLFALGIFGEYLARMHFRTMKKPAYCILATTSTFSDEPSQKR
jgi:glycosyltransferase involved in cell wall biosynthesis